MKLSKQCKTLTRDQRKAWERWAKDNRMMLDSGNLRRVSGHKAFTMVLNNRALAGEAAEPSVLPDATAWLDNPLTMDDAGPFTTNAGYVGFRVVAEIPDGTKWFVWATPPVDGSEADPHRLLRFVKAFSLGAVEVDDLVPSFGNDYAAVHGSWDGPGEEGEWPAPKFIWFRLHQYANGILGPGVMMRGQIVIEL